MKSIIEEYYEKAHIIPLLLRQKMEKLNRHPDVKAEFENWIKTGHYQSQGICVKERGYTAQKLADLSPYLDGEGAFMILMELRESPEKALRRIELGFKIK